MKAETFLLSSVRSGFLNWWSSYCRLQHLVLATFSYLYVTWYKKGQSESRSEEVPASSVFTIAFVLFAAISLLCVVVLFLLKTISSFMTPVLTASSALVSESERTRVYRRVRACVGSRDKVVSC